MNAYPTLKITLLKLKREPDLPEGSAPAAEPPAASQYQVILEYSNPASVTDPAPGFGTAEFDHATLDRLALDLTDTDSLEEYGSALGKGLFGGLFADEKARKDFEEWYNFSSGDKPLPLRLSLAFHPSASDLQSLFWETLKNPLDGKLFAANERKIYFSRYLFIEDRLPVPPKVKQDQIRGLAVIASPQTRVTVNSPDGSDKKIELLPLDVDREVARATDGLRKLGLAPTVLASRKAGVEAVPIASNNAPTLENIKNRLRDDCDVLYIVCHGYRFGGESFLLLEATNGDMESVRGADLVVWVEQLVSRPRLVALISCQSALNDAGHARLPEGPTPGEGLAFTALGPSLVQVGVPAVLAMQGDVSTDTMDAFLPVFFEELAEDGQLDRAVAAGRSSALDRNKDAEDSWMPVLFMQLRSGNLWDGAGLLVTSEKDFDKWESLANQLDKGRCTPVLGFGLNEPLIGSRRQIAVQWKELYDFDIRLFDRGSLAEVAQYIIALQSDISLPRDNLVEAITSLLRLRYGTEVSGLTDTMQLTDMLAEVVKYYWEHNMVGAYKLLAELPFPVYINATLTSMLVAALKKAGKTPQQVSCPWGNDSDDPAKVAWPPSIYDEDANKADADMYRQSDTMPMVYDFFGNLSDPQSVVLARDEYMDSIINMTKNTATPPDPKKNRIDSDLRAALTKTLVFLGFQIDDWDFRMLLRLIKKLWGFNETTIHVAVQIDPADNMGLTPQQAHHYLRGYFGNARLSLYWGSPEDFLNELRVRLELFRRKRKP
jgi:hypothetical protein